MTAPLSFSRVMALLRRLSPVWPSADPDTSVGKELGSIGVALGMAADPLDALTDEIFADTTDALMSRWEKICRIASRPQDDLEVRRARVLSVLRRSSGPRIDQLGKMLAPVLDCDIQDLIFIEGLRSEIDDALRLDSGVIAYNNINVTIPISTPMWPGVIDDRGVDIYIETNAAGVPVTLTHPDGTAWVTSVDGAQTRTNRTLFLGKRPGGVWQLTVNVGVATNFTRWELLVSNDIDSGRIYDFFCFRDPDLAGTSDLVEAQRLFDRTALAHMRSFVIESDNFKTDDPHSLCDRDIMGA